MVAKPYRVYETYYYQVFEVCRHCGQEFDFRWYRSCPWCGRLSDGVYGYRPRSEGYGQRSFIALHKVTPPQVSPSQVPSIPPIVPV